MDYEFLRDITGQVMVTFSMGHEAIGHWINEELKGNLSQLDQIENVLQQQIAGKGTQPHWRQIGHEYTLWIDSEEVRVGANSLDYVNEELEEGMNYYDEESMASCGTEDFLTALQHYRDFIVNHR
ncbi:YacL family protein [Biostraticola tofi]|uniref:UPF0231 protein EDC52_102521 n=1 Tax=Biostraticola tofi TaxID=466109 RepID=A0A4R3Z5A3_9GAMM|nr:YacL family protein [Biostraticola tofi]TCV99179.1 hypothetical protein EDC52_102521 [Biostraticola tofi]